MPQASGAEDIDQTREAAAYNSSIYLMAGMPFLLVAGFGFGVYRSLNKREGGGDAPLTPPSPPASGESEE